MIFTFQEINGSCRRLLYAENRDEAFLEMRIRYGSDADNYCLISYVEAKRFNLTLN